MGNPWEEPGLTVEERARLVWDETGSELQRDILAALRAAARDARAAALREAEGVLRAGSMHGAADAIAALAGRE